MTGKEGYVGHNVHIYRQDRLIGYMGQIGMKSVMRGGGTGKNDRYGKTE
jgi:hypothetical protein